MQNNFFDDINVSTRLIILFLLILCIMFAQSPYLIILLSIFCIILIILTGKSVKYYLYFIKEVKYLLLFIYIAYIIIYRNISYSFIVLYKLILIALTVKQFSLTVNFKKMTNGVKTILRPFINKIDIDKLAYNIVSFIYFIKFYINSKKDILLKRKNKIYYQFSFKYNIFPRILFATNELKKIESSLKLNFYEIKVENNNSKSKGLLIVFFIAFIVVIFKEVIM